MSLRPFIAVAGLAGGLLLGELVVRVWNPNPAVQVVRGHGLRLLGGTPVWGDPLALRSHAACAERHPERARIAFIGDSVTYGSGLEDDQIFTALLEDRLNKWQSDPGFCVLNFAEPGFRFPQKRALAADLLPKYRPALVFWELWREWGEYQMIGSIAVEAASFAPRADGYPGIRGVPDGLNHWLFDTSRVDEALDLAMGERRPGYTDPRAFTRQMMRDIAAVASSAGSRPYAYYATPLWAPFGQVDPGTRHWQQAALDEGQAQGVPVTLLQDRLLAWDYRDLRLDACCHFNPKGQQVLAGIFEQIVREQLEPPQPNTGLSR